MPDKIDLNEIDRLKAAIEATVRESLKIVLEDSRKLLVNTDIKLFPRGIDLIDVEAKLGPPSSTVFDFHLKLAGWAGSTDTPKPPVS
jgi:hypothetical protein